MANSNKKYFWLKMPKDFFEDRFVKNLRRQAGGDTMLIVYIKMLLNALETNGFYYYEGIEEDLIQEIASDICENPDVVRNTCFYLISKKLMIMSDDEAQLTQMAELIGSETESAKRVRKFRELKKNEIPPLPLHCNADVTQAKRLCNTEKEIEKEKESESEKEIDSDKEKESEKKINKKTKKEKKKQAESFSSVIDSYTDNQDLKQVLNDFIEMRKDIDKKKPLTVLGLKRALNELDRIAVDDLTKIDIVNQSILFSWKGLFPLKSKNNNSNNQKGRTEKGYAF